jgi:chemosensory pili system protein ChpA (sensor histidine kinase/response regulator)
MTFLGRFGCQHAERYFSPARCQQLTSGTFSARLPKTMPTKSPARRRPTVLVADDSITICELLQLYLETAGYDVLIAADGDAAIHLVRESKPDLAIVDIDMPYLSGDEFVAALRSDGATRDIPVIFLSSREDLADHAKLLNAVAYLPKPVRADRLLDVVALYVVR